MWQKIGFILIGLGVLVMLGWTVQVFLTDPEVPLLLKIAIGAVGAGILILIVVVIKDRLTRAKTEDFKEVEN
jgi:hypothetical protein